jgi:hypothetical protein
MKKINIDNFRIGEEVLITTYNPPIKAKISDMYEIPYNQVMLADKTTLSKYRGGNVPFFEVFLKDGKIASFVKDIVKKV